MSGQPANIYQDFMRVLQLKYEGADRAFDNVAKLLRDMNVRDVTSPTSMPFESPESAPVSDRLGRTDQSISRGSGLDIIISDPRRFVNMSYTLDFFLGYGRFPRQGELHKELTALFEIGRLPSGIESRSDLRMNIADTVEGIMGPAGAQHEMLQPPFDTPQWPLSPAHLRQPAAMGLPVGSRPGTSLVETHDPLGYTNILPDDFNYEMFVSLGRTRTLP